jgi:hypothetical protein
LVTLQDVNDFFDPDDPEHDIRLKCLDSIIRTVTDYINFRLSSEAVTFVDTVFETLFDRTLMQNAAWPNPR